MTTNDEFSFVAFQTERHGPRLTARLEPGVHAIVTKDRQAAQDLIHCATGLLPPQRGRVTWQGREPRKTPSLRAKIPCLLPIEQPLMVAFGSWWPRFRRSPKTTVEQVLGTILAQRNKVCRGPAVAPRDLDDCRDLLLEDPQLLDNTALRKIALALAVSHPGPAALFLFEPFAELSASQAVRLSKTLNDFSERGSVVVLLTRSQTEAQWCARRTFPWNLTLSSMPETQSYLVTTDQPDELQKRLDAQRVNCERTASPLGLLVHASDASEDENHLLTQISEAARGNQSLPPLCIRDLGPDGSHRRKEALG